MFWQAKRWSLQKRSLIIASCAVGATAAVIAGIFTYALIRADFSSDKKSLAQLASAALHIVEHEILSRSDELRLVAEQIAMLGPDGDVQALLGAMQFGVNGYAWIGIADKDGVVTASTGGVLKGQNMKDAKWFQSAMEDGSSLTGTPDPEAAGAGAFFASTSCAVTSS